MLGLLLQPPFGDPATTHFIYKVALVLFTIPPDPPDNARSLLTASESPTSRRAIHSGLADYGASEASESFLINGNF